MGKYQSYKLEPELWISEIPFHWKKSRVGRHFKIERGRVISKEEIQDNLGEYPVYSSQTTNNGELGKISTYDFDGEYVTWTTDGEKTGTCFYRNGKFNTTNVCGMLSLRETTPYSLNFLNYYLNQVTRPYVRLDINPKLMNNMMSEIPLIIPPLHEQIQIVQFLDEKTELIDKLISTKERKITLLKEQRTSLINQFVTKGLNPNVKMKNSRVEWIGEIPEHWSIGKLNYLCERIGDGLHSTPIYFDNTEFYFINGNNIKEDKIVIFENTKTVEYEEFVNHYIELNEKNTLLLSINGTIGSLGYYKNEKVILGKSVCYINIISDSINLDYLFFLLGSSSIQNYFTFQLTGTTIYNLSLNSIRKTPICLPNKIEQLQIVEHLNSKTKEIDDLVQLEQKKIDLLKEYRQSLISEVVTGKIKVTTDE